jgi:uncharacterized membrane protein
MDIPLNPLLDTPIVLPITVYAVLASLSFVVFTAKRKNRVVRIITPLTAAIGIVGIAGTLVIGLQARDEWRSATRTTLLATYGIVVSEDAVSDLLVRDKEVKAIGPNGEEILVKLKGDYTEADSELISSGKVLPKF